MGKVEPLGIAGDELDIPRFQFRRLPVRLGKHAFRDVDVEDVSGRPNPLRRFVGEEVRPRGDVGNAEPRLDIRAGDKDCHHVVVNLGLGAEQE